MLPGHVLLLQQSMQLGCMYKLNSSEHIFATGGRGVPIHGMLRNDHAVQVDFSILPEVQLAVQEFESNEGQLTYFSVFGEDPLCNNPALVTQREVEFHRQFPDMTEFFHTVVNGDYLPFREGILSLIRISEHLCTQL